MTLREVGFASLLLVISSYTCAATSLSWGNVNPQAVSISLTELLSVGDRFHGWSVRVVGVLHFSGEKSMLFLSKEAYENFDTASAIGIDLRTALNSGLADASLRENEGKYVQAEGRFRSYPRRKLKDMEVEIGVDVAGVVDSVTRIDLIDGRN